MSKQKNESTGERQIDLAFLIYKELDKYGSKLNFENCRLFRMRLAKLQILGERIRQSGSEIPVQELAESRDTWDEIKNRSFEKIGQLKKFLEEVEDLVAELRVTTGSRAVDAPIALEVAFPDFKGDTWSTLRIRVQQDLKEKRASLEKYFNLIEESFRSSRCNRSVVHFIEKLLKSHQKALATIGNPNDSLDSQISNLKSTVHNFLIAVVRLLNAAVALKIPSIDLIPIVEIFQANSWECEISPFLVANAYPLPRNSDSFVFAKLNEEIMPQKDLVVIPPHTTPLGAPVHSSCKPFGFIFTSTAYDELEDVLPEYLDRFIAHFPKTITPEDGETFLYGLPLFSDQFRWDIDFTHKKKLVELFRLSATNSAGELKEFYEPYGGSQLFLPVVRELQKYLRSPRSLNNLGPINYSFELSDIEPVYEYLHGEKRSEEIEIYRQRCAWDRGEILAGERAILVQEPTSLLRFLETRPEFSALRQLLSIAEKCRGVRKNIPKYRNYFQEQLLVAINQICSDGKRDIVTTESVLQQMKSLFLSDLSLTLDVLDPSHSSDEVKSKWSWSSHIPYAEVISIRPGIYLAGQCLQQSKIEYSLGSELRVIKSIIPEGEYSHSGLRTEKIRVDYGGEIVKAINSGQLTSEEIKEVAIRFNAMVVPRNGDPFSDRWMEAEDRRFDSAEQGKVIEVLNRNLVVYGEKSWFYGKSKARVVVSLGKRPACFDLPRVKTACQELSVSDLLERYNKDDDEWRKKLLEVLVKASNSILDDHLRAESATEGIHPSVIASIKEISEINVALSSVPGYRVIPGLQDSVTEAVLIETCQRFGVKSKKLGECNSRFDSGQVLIKALGGAWMLENYSHLGHGEVQYYVSLGPIGKWRVDCANRIIEAMRPFASYCEKFDNHAALLSAIEQNYPLCQQPQDARYPHASVSSNVCLAGLIAAIDSIADIAAHVDSGSSDKIQEIRLSSITALENELAENPSNNHFLPGLSQSSLNSNFTVPYVQFLVPGEKDRIVSVISREIVIDGRPRTSVAYIGLGYDGPVPTHWELVQKLYVEFRLASRCSDRGLDEFLDLRTKYLTSRNDVMLVPLIQAAEMSLQEFGEKEERPEFRAAIDAIERVLEKELRLRRIRLQRWSPLPSGGNYSAYRIRQANLPGRARNLVVRILQPAYLNLNDNSINNSGLVQVTG